MASLELFEKTGLLQALPAKVERLRYYLDRMSGLPCVGDVRQKGLMAGVELVEDRKTKAPAAVATAQLMESTRENRILLGKGGLYGNVLRIATIDTLRKEAEARFLAADPDV